VLLIDGNIGVIKRYVLIVYESQFVFILNFFVYSMMASLTDSTNISQVGSMVLTYHAKD